MLQRTRVSGLLSGMSYGDLMDDLCSAWRLRDASEPVLRDDGYWVHTLVSVFEVLEALGLSVPVPKPVPKKRGRPKKDILEHRPKRPRGRPRKNPV